MHRLTQMLNWYPVIVSIRQVDVGEGTQTTQMSKSFASFTVYGNRLVLGSG